METGQDLRSGDGNVGAVLVAGSGIGGMQAALDLAESGYKVYLVEEGPAIGGTMAQLDKTFPTNDCAMCTLAPRLVDCGRHPNVEKLTYSELLSVEGRPGRFRARVKKKPRSVDLGKCTGCGECSAACPVRNLPYPGPAESEPSESDAGQLAEVDAILDRYGIQQSSILPALQDINEKYRWLPPGAVKRVAEVVGLPLAQVLRIASFYNMFSFEPRGKHVVTVCDGTACHVRGSSRLLDTVREELAIGPGQTTPDRAFTLEVVNCLGACALAPVLVVDGKYHEKVMPDKLRRIVESYRKETAAAAT
jgi:NADH:ubiquinone oxidoreductase subunit E/NAD-dependent dihydropyrimidine dehydrogenase PreA subunit